MMTAPKDPNHWALLMLRMRLQLGAREPWQPGKDGGCHGNEKHSIQSQLWARDAPGGMGSRTRYCPKVREGQSLTLESRKAALLRGLPLAHSAWWEWAGGGCWGSGSVLGPAVVPLGPLPPSSLSVPRQLQQDMMLVPVQSRGATIFARHAGQERPPGFLQPGGLLASLIMSMNPKYLLTSFGDHYAPPGDSVSLGQAVAQSRFQSLNLRVWRLSASCD